MNSVNQDVTDCFVCRKHRGEIRIPGGAVYEDELVYASHGALPEDQSTMYLGILFVEPKRHLPGLAELTDTEARAIGLLVTRLGRALKKSEKAEHIYSFVYGDHVPHLHIWVVPRYPGTPREYWGMKVDEWPEAPKGGAEDITSLSERLRVQLHSESGGDHNP
jgi:histidine triad (HIT) family protein